MRTFNFNLTFVIIFISFYCSVAIGSSPLGTEHSAPFQNSEPIPGVVKNEHESLATEEILSPKKYLKRHLENVKKEGLPEKSPDREHLPIVVGKEAPSTIVEKDDHPTVPSLEPPATSLTTQTPTEGSETHSITPEKELFPAEAVSEKKTPYAEKEEGSLPMEGTDTQTTAEDSKSVQTATVKEALSILLEDAGHEEAPEAFVPVKPEEMPEELHIEEVKESSVTETVPSEPITETIKDEEDLKPAWNIWHKDPTHNVLLAVAIILIAAKIGGWMAGMLRLPAVVGKLIIGIILGNIFTFTGWDFFDFLRTMPFLKMISYFGTLTLLFTVGLNIDLRALLRVGTSSLLVCLGGIIVPAGLGLMVGHFFLPDTSVGTKLILAIILCNTATGLKLAVLRELKALNTLEGMVITGATVLTDIVVFLTFGVVSEFAARGGVSFIGMSVSFGIAIISLIISVIIILRYSEKFGNFLARRMTEGMNIPIVAILSLLLAFMFGSVGLHTIMGAFVAGLFMRNVKLRDSDDDGEHRTIESFIKPFYMILVPILFVRVGAQVDVKSFLNMEAVSLGLAITGAAVIGKMFCSICPIEKGINRLAIGLAMVMKMDGTLITAGIARDMGMLNDAVFSSLIVVIVLTSTIFPPLLRLSLLKKSVHRKGLHTAAEKKELEEVTLN